MKTLKTKVYISVMLKGDSESQTAGGVWVSESAAAASHVDEIVNEKASAKPMKVCRKPSC